MKLSSRCWFNAPTLVTYAQIWPMPQNWTFLVQCAYFSHIRPNLADAKLSSRFGSMRLLPSHTPKSSWCEVLKPFSVQCAYFSHIHPNPVDAKFSSRIWVNAPTLVTVPNTSKSSWCEALKPFSVQCAYFSHIRPNPANAKLSSRIWYTPKSSRCEALKPFSVQCEKVGVYAQIQPMRSFEAVFGSMRLL